MVFKWAPGSRVKGILPQVAGTHLERLRRKNGDVLTPGIVVADARSEASPLHGAFEWSDRRAAFRFRETQAAYILRSLVIVTKSEDDDGEDLVVRAFLSIEDEDGERSYTSVVRAMKDPDLRQQVLAEALADFEELRRKYRHFKELASVYEALDEVAVKA